MQAHKTHFMAHVVFKRKEGGKSIKEAIDKTSISITFQVIHWEKNKRHRKKSSIKAILIDF
jgi:hypothetical protein